MSPENAQFVRRIVTAVIIVAVAVVLLYLLRQVSTVFLTAFAGILLGVLLDALVQVVRKRTPLPRRVAWGIVCIGGMAVLVGSLWLVGPHLATQLQELGVRLPDAVERIRSHLGRYAWGQYLLNNVPSNVATGGMTSFTGVFSTALGAVGNTLVILFVGVYLAYDPALYRDNAIRLLPVSRRERARETAESLSRAMRHWLAGRFASMFVVGVLTTIGLLIVGLPLAPTLGFIAGAFSFVPYLGPIVSAVPAVLVGLLESPTGAVSAVIVYVVVQFLESYMITPLIQRRAVSIPPALLILAQVMGGLLFGILGILLATPITVCLIVLVQMLYVEDVLGDEDVRPLGS